MESRIKSIMIKEIDELFEKISSEINDVSYHMDENSIHSFNDIQDELILYKYNNFNSMLIGLKYWLMMFEKIFGYKYIGKKN